MSKLQPRRIVLALVLLLAARSWGIAAEPTDLAGKWRLVVLAFNDDPFLIFTLEEKDGRLAAELTSAQSIFREIEGIAVERQGERLRIEVANGPRKEVFVGTVSANDQPILGTFRFGNTLYPARLERTEETAVGKLGRGPIGMKLGEIMRGSDDAAAKAAQLKELEEKHRGSPALAAVYAELLRGAEERGESVEAVQSLVAHWLDAAKLYGGEWLLESRIKALAALAKSPRYAALRLDVAQAAQRDIAAVEATTQQQSSIARALADAAEATGHADLAKTAREQWQTLETKLDEEYHATVPPFKPEPFAGRANPQDNRVVLLELFTGAQCPPCVAADVAFDALLSGYQPRELIGLQYHLHIPGPDPLTNPASLARSKFYQVRGTPSTFFNGAAEAGGGGGMDAAHGKYVAYQAIIAQQLAGQRAAEIDLKVTRSGDDVHVSVAATAKPGAAPAPAESKPSAPAAKAERAGDEPAKTADAEEPAPELRLRLVLVEESIRYVGGNQLRFHHHVVRSMPGGPDGKELVDGHCQSDLTINLRELRDNLEQYLTEYEQDTSFPQPRPAIDLRGLSLVALVQNDADKSVLDAILVPVPDAN